MHALRLFLISLKSPRYWSAIFGGMSPFAIRSTYSAATFSGPITASSVAFTPSTIARNSPWCLVASARAASFPSTAAVDRVLASATSACTAATQVLKALAMASNVCFVPPVSASASAVRSVASVPPWARRSSALTTLATSAF